LPYPRIHITNVRGHGIPPCPLCVFPPGDACSPTEFTEFTEISGVEEPPTDFTDAHRWLGCLDFCVEIVWWLRGYGRDAIPSYSLHCLLCWCT
jgi:hypothetical protein